MFDRLPPELSYIILEYLSPRDVQSLQCATGFNYLNLYRQSKQYLYIDNDEKKSFESYAQDYFFDYLHKKQHIPMLVIRNCFADILFQEDLKIKLFELMQCRALNHEGRALLSVYNHTLLETDKNLNWTFFLSLIVNAKQGSMPLLSLQQEQDVAITLVKFGKEKYVKRILENFNPTTPEMIMCMLHFHMKIDPQNINHTLLTQEVCNYWILNSSSDSKKWLINHLPSTISIHTILLCNCRLFMNLATLRTLKRYQILNNLTTLTNNYLNFFPALFQYHKRYKIEQETLVHLNNIHIKCHGTIGYLTSPKCIFKPSLEILYEGAKQGDPLFKLWINKLSFLSNDQKQLLIDVALFHCNPKVPHQNLPYLFSSTSIETPLSYENLIQQLLDSKMTYIECEPKQ